MKQETTSLGRAWLIILVVIAGGAFLYMIRAFLIPVVLSAVFSSLLAPANKWLRGRVKGRRNLAAAIMLFLFIIVLLVPLYFVGNMVAGEAVRLYQNSEQQIQEIIAQVQQGEMTVSKIPLVGQFIEEHQIDIAGPLTSAAQSGANWLVNAVSQTSRGTVNVIVDLVIMLFTLFYFFRDGDRITLKLLELSPLPDLYELRLVSRFTEVSRATVRGTLLLGLIQGTMGAITLAAVGVQGVAVWGIVMVVLSVIPMVGSWLVMYPAAVFLLIGGKIWQSIFVVVFTALVIGNIDNLLRPRLVGKDARMHDLLILFSTIGGIGLFGLMGFIVGPILAALLLTLLELFTLEFYGTSYGFVREGPEPEEKHGEGETPAKD